MYVHFTLHLSISRKIFNIFTKGQLTPFSISIEILFWKHWVYTLSLGYSFISAVLIERAHNRTEKGKAKSEVAPGFARQGPDCLTGTTKLKPQQRQWVAARVANVKFFSTKKFGLFLEKNENWRVCLRQSRGFIVENFKF